jgi:hypothetical protein
MRWQKANKLLTDASVRALDIGARPELISSCEVLQIRKGYAEEGLFSMIQKRFRIMAITATCVRTRLFFEP